jgi:hypothetical protein
VTAFPAAFPQRGFGFPSAVRGNSRMSIVSRISTLLHMTDGGRDRMKLNGQM